MCQLVLGAGAMQVAGLKSITAKHLALSCQCLGALISLHPALVAAMGAHLPASRRALLTQELSLVLQVRPCTPVAQTLGANPLLPRCPHSPGVVQSGYNLLPLLLSASARCSIPDSKCSSASCSGRVPSERHFLRSNKLEGRWRLQDLTLHRGEVHSKLVGIMRERLISSLKQLPALAGRWGAAPTGNPQQPSSFSLNLVKQLRTLSQVAHRALPHLLLPS